MKSRLINKIFVPTGILFLLLYTGIAVSRAVAGSLPGDRDLLPKSSWKAEASSVQEPTVPAAFAIDGDVKTRWSSLPEDPSWIQIDLGKTSEICGAVILWEAAFASEYCVLVSTDRNRWDTVFTCLNGNGRTDDLYFKPCLARFVRIVGTRRATGWGYSIYEIGLKGIDEWPVITTDKPSESSPGLVLDGLNTTAWQPVGIPAELTIDLRKEKVFNGMQVFWGNPFATGLDLRVSKDGQSWETVAVQSDGTGGRDELLCEKTLARFVRLDIRASGENRPVQIREITFMGPEETVTPLALFQIAAGKSKPGWYPDHLRKQQVYWTLVGVPGEKEESILDEYGNLEPFKGSCSLMPYIYTENHLVSAFDASSRKQEMALGSLPVPSVTWTLPGMNFRVDAVARGERGQAVTYIKYRLENTSREELEGKIYLAIRSVQINPVWQYGGLSPIRSLSMTRTGYGFPAVSVNDRELFVVMDSVDGFGVVPFDRGDIINEISKGKLPPALNAANSGEYLSGAMEFRYELEPGGVKEIVVAVPLFGNHDALEPFIRGDLARTKDPGKAFGLVKKEMTAYWDELIRRDYLTLPDTAVVNTLNAQVGYILVNLDGVSIQPGSRNYKRSWMRDGSLTSAALLRLGQAPAVKAFLDWYSASILPDGLVPPVLNNDGSVNEGFGSNLEWDSQGEYLFAMAEYFRFTKDTAFIRQHYEKIRLAMKFLVELRGRTLVPGYMKDNPPSSRFAGILPGSISHEGYSTPTHSYWDDFFALKGWKDGKMIAELLGDDKTAAWAGDQYRLLRASVKSSIEQTMAWKKIRYIPGSADKGDLDPTSTTIAFFPCEEQDLLSKPALDFMYDNYYNEVHGRTTAPWHGSYTPYEVRNITAFVKLGEKDKADFLLNFILGHRRPAGWNELAEVIYGDERLGGYIGDMPHTWVGSGYINAVRGMIVSESGGGINLFQGAPAHWFTGNGIQLTLLPTWFGPLTLLAVTGEKKFTLTKEGSCNPSGGYVVYWPWTGKPVRVTVDGREWQQYNDKTCSFPGNACKIVAEW